MRTCLLQGLQPCCSPASGSLPHGSSRADSLGPPELPCPEEWEPGALRIGRFPQTVLLRSCQSRVSSCPGLGHSATLLPTGLRGSGRGQPLHGRLLAHRPHTPVLCRSQSQQPTPGPQTVL